MNYINSKYCFKIIDVTLPQSSFDFLNILIAKLIEDLRLSHFFSSVIFKKHISVAVDQSGLSLLLGTSLLESTFHL